MNTQETVQIAQDIYRLIEEAVEDVNEPSADLIRNALEQIEDLLERYEGADDERAEVFVVMRQAVQLAQDQINHLQREVHKDKRLAQCLERLEDAVERIEDQIIEDLIDIELCAKAGGHRPPKAKRYKIKIDKEKYIVKTSKLIGRELLALVNKTPEGYGLYLKSCTGKPEKIEPNDVVDLRRPGIERFMTIPYDQQEGEFRQRRQFQMPEEDRLWLENSGLEWETVVTGRVRRLVIYSFLAPAGYTQQTVDLNLRIEPGYPDSQIDMAYFYPPLVRSDGRAIKAISHDSFDSKSWQRWSRHRTQKNPWRPGLDSLATHLAAVEGWLNKELTR